MDVARHEIEGGWTLIERDRDLFGHVLTYGIEGTEYELVRLPIGWRARLATRGNARRTYKSPAYDSAPAVVRYLVRYGKIRHRRQLSP